MAGIAISSSPLHSQNTPRSITYRLCGSETFFKPEHRPNASRSTRSMPSGIYIDVSDMQSTNAVLLMLLISGDIFTTLSLFIFLKDAIKFSTVLGSEMLTIESHSPKAS